VLYTLLLSHNMPLEPTLAKFTLPLLAALALYSTFYQSTLNDFIPYLRTLQASASPYLPDSSLPLRAHWTGILVLDRLAVQFIAFFWPVLSGEHPAFSLQAVHFLGQGYAIWTLLLVEAFRVGNTWRAVSFITVWGLLMENGLMAGALPVFCVVHLWTSPTVQLKVLGKEKGGEKATGTDTASLTAGATTNATALLVHPSELALLPYSIALTAGLPTLFVLISPTGSTTQQFYLVLRQLHPLLLAIVHPILSIATSAVAPIFASASSTATPHYDSPTQRNRAVLRSLNSVYTFATITAMVTQSGVVALILASQTTRRVFAPGYLAYFAPSSVFEPPRLQAFDFSSPSSSATATYASTPISSWATGAHQFLQYDELFSMAAILVWATALNRAGVVRPGDKDQSGIRSWLALLGISGARARTLLWCVVGGPAAAAIQLVRERDEWWLSGEREEGAGIEGSEKNGKVA